MVPTCRSFVIFLRSTIAPEGLVNRFNIKIVFMQILFQQISLLKEISFTITPKQKITRFSVASQDFLIESLIIFRWVTIEDLVKEFGVSLEFLLEWAKHEQDNAGRGSHKGRVQVDV